MNRIFITSLVFITLLNAKSLTEIDKEIAVSKTRLVQNENRETTLQTRMQNLSNEIKKANSELENIVLTISKNDKEIVQLESAATSEKEEKIRLTKERDKLIIEKAKIEKELVAVVSSHLIESLVLSNDEPLDEKDLVIEQVFRALNQNTTTRSAELKRSYSAKIREIAEIETKLNALQSKLERLVEARERQSTLKRKQASAIKELDSQKNRYLNDLNRLIAQKNEERQMLANLSVLRQKTVDSLKQQQLSKQEARELSAVSTQNISVKQYGTSYQQASSSSYRGAKVKAPFDDRYPVSLIKEFGPYTDPIYNIKIHNDSVTLKSTQDSIVRSVLAGKVIFADDLKLLGKVVIIEHADNMHTIYRNLETISPNIKLNKRISQRESIGRVASELVFEVTKNGLPINPLQLIAIK